MPPLSSDEAEILNKAIIRLKELMPSYRDPRHYASHEDIALVQQLEAWVDNHA